MCVTHVKRTGLDWLDCSTWRRGQKRGWRWCRRRGLYSRIQILFIFDSREVNALPATAREPREEGFSFLPPFEALGVRAMF